MRGRGRYTPGKQDAGSRRGKPKSHLTGTKHEDEPPRQPRGERVTTAESLGMGGIKRQQGTGTTAVKKDQQTGECVM